MSEGAEIKESRGMRVVERMNEDSEGYEFVLKYLLVLGQNQTNFRNYFCPIHCTMTSYTDIWLYICGFWPGNDSKGRTVLDEGF